MPNHLRVLFVSLMWDYKDPGRGLSFEFTNLWDSLRRIEGVKAGFFGFDEVARERGRTDMNRALLSRVELERPDLVFFFLFEDEFDPLVLQRISKVSTTVNWFADDHWRFFDFSRRWAGCFTWIATTDPVALPRYRSHGFENVLLTQWACNHHLYRPLGRETDLPVTFVGQPHGSRRRVVSRLRSSGIPVKTWGYGWPEGRVAQEQLVEIFNRSQVNLNLANASIGNLRESFHIALGALKDARDVTSLAGTARKLAASGRQQLKGRNFEVPGCGGFLLTNEVPHLDEYFVPGEEVATFKGIHDLSEKARYFLEHDEERIRIAQAGFRRTIAEHTYEHRFKDLFRKMGLM